MKPIKLFCIPYAGSSATVYKKWKRYLHNNIELHPLELAGRGERYGVPFYNTFVEAVEDLYQAIEDHLNGSYAFFGHSMGSWLIVELADKLKTLGCRAPEHIFFSGNRAPHIYRDEKILHKLPDDEFKEEILRLGGTPQELFENRDLLAYFCPVLRADYQIVENYYCKYCEGQELKLDCDISVLNGLKDDLTAPELAGWQGYTKFQCNIHHFQGGHFFINEQVGEVTQLINDILVERNEA